MKRPSAPACLISSMSEAHWPAVCAIYQAGIDTGHATFADAPPASWEAWRQTHLNELSIVAVEAASVSGWAALAPVSSRCVYAGVAEVSIYVAPTARGHGVGQLLLKALIEASEAQQIWTLQAGIFPENTASVALHRSVGFTDVGVRRALGRMGFGPLAGRWRDVLLLERRSSVAGRD
jgi:phosphinothricin acetyltransferase